MGALGHVRQSRSGGGHGGGVRPAVSTLGGAGAVQRAQCSASGRRPWPAGTGPAATAPRAAPPCGTSRTGRPRDTGWTAEPGFLHRGPASCLPASRERMAAPHANPQRHRDTAGRGTPARERPPTCPELPGLGPSGGLRFPCWRAPEATQARRSTVAHFPGAGPAHAPRPRLPGSLRAAGHCPPGPGQESGWLMLPRGHATHHGGCERDVVDQRRRGGRHPQHQHDGSGQAPVLGDHLGGAHRASPRVTAASSCRHPAQPMARTRGPSPILTNEDTRGARWIPRCTRVTRPGHGRGNSDVLPGGSSRSRRPPSGTAPGAGTSHCHCPLLSLDRFSPGDDSRSCAL